MVSDFTINEVMFLTLCIDGPDANPSMQFSLISTRDANPPVFTFTFNVSDGPPTYVTCTDGSNPLIIASG